MENNKDEYLMIDHTIELDVSKLPKLMQNTIADLEEYEKKGEWVMYDGLADGLESFAKSALLQNVISEAQFNQILKKYPTVSSMLLQTEIHETTVVKAALMRKESVTDYAKKTRGNSKSRARLYEEMTNLINELKEKGLV